MYMIYGIGIERHGSIGYKLLVCYYASGFYIILQGLGLIFIKSTKDPLERISKIGYLQLVSVNQHPNIEFMKNMEQIQEWKELSSTEK